MAWRDDRYSRWLGVYFLIVGLFSATVPRLRAAPPRPDASPSHPLPPVSLSDLEEKLWDALNRGFNEPYWMDCRVHPASGSLPVSGHFERVDVTFTDGYLDIVPVVSAQLCFRDVVLDVPYLYQHGDIRLTSRSAVDVRLVASEAGLNEALKLRSQSLQVESPHVSLRRGAVEFTGRLKTFFIRSRITTVGTFAVERGAKVSFVPDHLSVGALTMPHRVVAAIATRMNPIVDLSHIKDWTTLTFTVKRIVVVNDQLVLEGGQVADLLPVPRDALNFR